VATSKLVIAALDPLGGLDAVDPFEAGEHVDLLARLAPERALELQAAFDRPTRHAPEELDARVAADVAGAAEMLFEPSKETPVVHAIRTLSRYTAPDVLDRLVAEELEQPLSKRWVRDLARMRAPQGLAPRVASEFHWRRSWPRSIGLLVGGAAAAILVLAWIPGVLGGRSVRATARVHDPRLVLVEAEGDALLPPVLSSLQTALAPEGERLTPEEVAARARPAESLPDDLPRLERPAGAVDPARAGPGASGAAGPAASTTGAGAAATTPSGVLTVHPLDNRASPVPHWAVRRVESYAYPDGAQGGIRYGGYREIFVSDGEGRFEIQPYESLLPDRSGLGGEGAFLQALKVQEGFLHRYRDFAVRDAGLFQRNFRAAPAGTAVVADRTCDVVEIKERTTGATVFAVAVDPATGLVLRSTELDEHGRIVSSVEYEALGLDVDLSGVRFHAPANAEQEVELSRLAEVETTLGYAPLLPDAVPEGYALHEASTVVDGGGRGWLKLTFLDGIRPLFFLQARADPRASVAPGARPGAGAGVPGRVVSYDLGSMHALQGRWADVEFIAVGKTAVEELHALVESALP